MNSFRSSTISRTRSAVPAAFAVVAAVRNRPLVAGALLAVGALTKPQCVYLLPVVAAIVMARNRGRLSRALTSASRLSSELFVTPEKRFLGVDSATPSTSVFQAPQCGHCPCHFGDSPPHSVQA